jgi:polyisoprenoid-binding protein YceI
LSLFAFTTHIDKVNANKTNSTVIWTGSKPTGSHTGNVILKNGYLSFDHGQLVGGEFTMNMTSIICTDLEPDKGGNKLVKHLKNEDFFDVNQFPEAKLIINKVRNIKGSEFEMNGNMTIKGITKPVTFNADIKINKNSYTAIAKLIIDRTEWGIEYSSKKILGSLADKFIYDDIEFDIFLVSEK